MKPKHIHRPSINLYLLLLIILSVCMSAYPVKNDEIQEALEMNSYAKDTTASAVIISDQGRSYFNFNHPRFGLELVFERKILVKIFDADGYSWADINIPLYIGETYEEDVVDLKGFTYNLVNGKTEKTKLSKESIFREETSDHWKQVKVTMPDVREGSVFELNYKVSSPFIFNLQSWTFQKSIPAIRSEYQAEIPEYFQYNKNVRGYFPISDHQTDSRLSALTQYKSNRDNHIVGTGQTSTSSVNFVENIEKWTAYDIPAFKDEPYMTDADNFKTAVTFELAYTKFPNAPAENYTTTWEAINQKLMESDDFGDALDRTGFLKNYMPEVIGSASTEEEKLLNIYRYVRGKVKWNETNSLFTSEKLKSVLEKGSGNSADINLLLLAMLRESGIKAYPVAISTRNHGMIFPTSPTITSFNYLVVGVPNNDQYLLIDATEPYAPLGLLPYRCLNGSGRLIDEKGGKWIDVSSQPDKEKTITEYTIDIDEESISGNHSHVYYDQAAYAFRNQFFSDDGSAFQKEMEEKVPGLEISKVTYEKMDDLAENPSVLCDITLNDCLTEAGDLIYFIPMFFDAMKSNPFKLEKRDYPVDYGTQIDDFYFSKINLPEGYVVESIPEEISIVLPNRAAEYIYSAKAVGNMLTLRSQLKINHAIFTAEHYADLKNFYDLIVKKQSEQVVIKRS
ncbi:MAG: DUF3857 domain-containing protein [Saprospiraceae bacterium]|nr:DUF3857 domain-containing protein [Saprospiraceae bacterium]